MIRSAAACLPVASVMSCDHTTLSAPIVIMIIVIVLIIFIIIIIIIYRRSSESFLPDHACQLPTRPVLWSHKTLPSAAKQVNRHIQDATKYRGQWTTAGHKRSQCFVHVCCTSWQAARLLSASICLCRKKRHTSKSEIQWQDELCLECCCKGTSGRAVLQHGNERAISRYTAPQVEMRDCKLPHKLLPAATADKRQSCVPDQRLHAQRADA